MCGGTAAVEFTPDEARSRQLATAPVAVADATKDTALHEEKGAEYDRDADAKLLASLHSSAMDDIEARVARAVEAERMVRCCVVIIHLTVMLSVKRLVPVRNGGSAVECLRRQHSSRSCKAVSVGLCCDAGCCCT
jgi:hypothetical protein